MIPKNGFNIKTSLSYELNSIFEEFKVNQDYGGFIESLTSHNTCLLYTSDAADE